MQTTPPSPPSPQSSFIAILIPLGATLKAQVQMTRRGGELSLLPTHRPPPCAPSRRYPSAQRCLAGKLWALTVFEGMYIRSLVAEEGSCPHGWAGSERRSWRHPAQGPVLVTRRGSAVGGGYGDPHKLGECVPEEVRRGAGARQGFRSHGQVPSPSSSPADPPCLYLLGRLRVQVRLQQRDRKLDLPWAVVGLHGARPGGRGPRAGAGALPLRCAPAPAPARRSACSSWLGAPCSAWGLCCCGLARHRPSRPPPPPVRSLNPIVAALAVARVAAPPAKEPDTGGSLS